MSKRAKAALAGAAGVVALAATYLVGPWEGKENRAYWDHLGKVWTICYGETKDVGPGMVMTDEQCSTRLYTRLENDFRKPLQRCIATFDEAPLSWQAAMLSLAYNVGIGSACTSTAAKRAREKHWYESCVAMTWFNRAGGRRVEGLVRRRESGDVTRIGEFEMCTTGL